MNTSREDSREVRSDLVCVHLRVDDMNPGGRREGVATYKMTPEDVQAVVAMIEKYRNVGEEQ